MWKIENRSRLTGVARAPIVLAMLLAAPALAAAGVHLGVATCASTTCHGSAKPTEGSNVQQNEYVTWSRFDPHAGAYRTLLDERSIAIARRLGIGRAHEASECLGCHADDVPEKERGARFQLDDGIGCETCHGAAEGWLASHDDPGVGHADNLAKGLTALEDPAARAAVCLGCHLGDANETDRYASHRLMAAGHPRLSFELDTFTELWRTSGGREHYVRDDDYARRKPTPAASRVWTTGLIAGAGAMTAQVARRYAEQGTLPDFALFNCYSCHRAMRLKDWQDKGRDAQAEPGRLRFDESVLVVLQTALVTRPALQSRLGRDATAFQKAAGTPRDAVMQAAARLEATLTAIGADLAARPLDRDETMQVLDALAQAGARGDYPDYAGAEQAAMGVAVLLSTAGSRDTARGAIDELFRTLENDERYDARRFARALEHLK